MIERGQLPKNNADLVKVDVEFPRLQPDTVAACPVSIEEVVEYLRAESPDGEAVHSQQLRFIRTAQVAEQKYWIWSFRESDGSDCYVTVSVGPDGGSCIGYEENYHQLRSRIRIIVPS